MAQRDLAFAVAVAVAASLLLKAGLAKSASPSQLRRASAELLSVIGHRLSAALARGFGTTEAIYSGMLTEACMFQDVAALRATLDRAPTLGRHE